MYAQASAGMDMNSVNQEMGSGIQQLESQLAQQMNEIGQTTNPSESQLAVFQGNVQLWTNLINMESSIFKVVGDTMKTIVTNMSS